MELAMKDHEKKVKKVIQESLDKANLTEEEISKVR